MIYLIIVILLLFLIINYDINGRKQNKEFWSRFVLFLLIAVAGLRYKLGVDTARYLYHFYHDVPKLWELTWNDMSYGDDPLFTLLNSVVLSLGGKFYIVQFIQAAFVNTLVYKYIKRHSSYVFTCLFFYFIWQYYGYNMEEMRAALAIVICLFANDYCLERKWKKAILLYAIASLFHFSSIIFLITPLLLSLRLNKTGIVVCAIAFVGSVLIAPFIESNLAMLEFSSRMRVRVGGYIDSETMVVSGLNIFGYITSIILYSYPIVAFFFIKKHDKKNNLLKLEPFIMGLTIVAIINLRLPVAYRYIHFYAIYFILFVSEYAIIQIRSHRIIDKRLRLIFASIILFPMVYLMISPYFDIKLYSRFMPYSSVIEKSEDPQRERVYSEYVVLKTLPNEY